MEEKVTTVNIPVNRYDQVSYNENVKTIIRHTCHLSNLNLKNVIKTQ